MPVEDVESLVADLRAHAGDAVRVVAEYDADGYHLAYARDEDVAERVKEQGSGVHRDLVLQEVGRDHLEDLFQAGSLQCSIHRFEELTAFHFVASDYAGLFVSVESDADFPLASFADTCREYL